MLTMTSWEIFFGNSSKRSLSSVYSFWCSLLKNRGRLSENKADQSIKFVPFLDILLASFQRLKETQNFGHKWKNTISWLPAGKLRGYLRSLWWDYVRPSPKYDCFRNLSLRTIRSLKRRIDHPKSENLLETEIPAVLQTSFDAHVRSDSNLHRRTVRACLLREGNGKNGRNRKISCFRL